MLFTLGREYSIPFPTICIGHMRIVRNVELVEMLLLNTWCVPSRGVNDNEAATKLY